MLFAHISAKHIIADFDSRSGAVIAPSFKETIMKYGYLTLILTLAVSTTTARAQGDAKTLEPRAAIQREIASGEKHSYQVPVASDQFLRLTVDQISVDVAVKVYRPGREPDDINLAVGVAQPEEIFLITGTAGVCLFEIRTAKEATRGAYEIRLEELRAATPQDRSVVEGLRGLVDAQQLFRQGGADNLRKAVEKFQELMTLFQSAQHKQGEADALLFLGLSHRRMGDNQKAMEFYNRALPLYRQTRQRQRESAILSNLASIYDSRGQADLARDHYKQSLAIALEIQDTVSQAIVLNNLSVICQSLGQYQDALSYLRQSLPLRRANGDRAGECRTLNNFASVYSNLGDYQTSLRYLTDALKIAQEEKNLDLEATTLNNYAVIHRSFGNHKEARTYLEQALPKMRAFNNPRMEAVALNNLGSVYLKLGETARAIDHLEQALKLMRGVEERHREAGTLNNLGMAYVEMRQYAKAMDFLSAALTLRREIGDQVGQADTLNGIALLERERGNLAGARARSEESLSIIESLRASVGSADLRTSYFASKRDYYDLFIDTLMRLHEQNPSEGHNRAALEASERARARGLVDSLAESRANLRQGVDTSLLERERGLQQLINSKESYRVRFRSNKATEKQAEELESELTRLLAEYAEVREQIRLKSPRYASLTQPATLSLGDIQRMLDRDTLLLEYSLGKNSSYLWAVTDSSITSFALPSRDEIEAAARRVYELATARNRRTEGESIESRRARIAQSDAEYSKAAMELSRMLIDPVASELNKKRLVIVAEGALQYVPFGALPAPKSLESGVKSLKSGKGKTPDSRLPLIADHEIISLPSVSALAALRTDAEKSTAPNTLAVFADPVFTSDDPRIRRNSGQGQSASAVVENASAAERSAKESGVADFRRLRFSRLEADAITSLAGAGSLKAIDFDANRLRASSEDMSRYRILHFATHGLLNNETPELSGLVLSLVDEAGKPVEGFLRLHEIYNLRLNADLVVLSACQTALGKEIRGEGLVGLTRGFMYAGAKRVVASLWSVEDRATAELMKRFYSRMLVEKMKPAAALRAAQRDMLKVAEWSSPYFWAAFSIQGEWK